MDEVWKKKVAWRKEQESHFGLEVEHYEGLDWCFWGTQGTHVSTTRLT